MARTDGVIPAPALALEAPTPSLAHTLFWGFARVLSIVALVVTWEVLARSGAFTPFVLPSLSSVLERIWTDALSGELAINTGLTVYRAHGRLPDLHGGGNPDRRGDVAQRHRQLVLRSDRIGRVSRCRRSPSCRW